MLKSIKLLYFKHLLFYLITELEKIGGVKVANPKGAFYCVAELPVDDTDDFAVFILTSSSENQK